MKTFTWEISSDTRSQIVKEYKLFYSSACFFFLSVWDGLEAEITVGSLLQNFREVVSTWRKLSGSGWM